jgi:hypothetical protein
MRKLEDEAVARKITLTVPILDKLQEEANLSQNGNVSALIRLILKKRYKS